VVLDLAVFDDSSANSQYRYSISRKAEKFTGNLERLATGHYQVVLPIVKPADYRIDLVEDRGGRQISFPPLAYSFTHSPRTELPRADFNTRLLARLAFATGGELNPKSLNQLNKVSIRTSRSTFRPGLILLAFGLFLAEVAMRKLAFGEPD
jgi:hypothetical protein